jgi:hypothetical protein
VANRMRQVDTVTRVVPNRLAMARFVMPLAASSTIDARIASPRDVFRRRARASSSVSSSSLSSIRTAFGSAHSLRLRPIRHRESRLH